MPDSKDHLESLRDIKQMMERSSRFISLSGWSGVAAGLSALIGAWFAYKVIYPLQPGYPVSKGGTLVRDNGYVSLHEFMGNSLFLIAMCTFVAAFVSAFFFTWLRSKKSNAPIWTAASRRLMINVSIPMLAGGVYLLRLVQTGTFGLIAPGCLIFYGLALVNASKYTVGEIRYLGYGQIILGVINCWFVGSGLFFWALGFGVLHIVYGTLMWWKYERV